MTSYTVSELNDIIKKTLQTEFKNKIITVSGEISNVKPSGRNTYLTLKDDNASLSVIFWGIELNNKHGDHVEITGKIELYTKTGNVNIIGNDIKMIGIGLLHTEYEKIKIDYEKKGYFNNRKYLPSTVKKIGIVTSAGGAALQDFIYVLEKNDFSGDIYIYDCIVQGQRSPTSIAAGIKFFNNSFFINTLNNTDGNGSDLSKSKKIRNETFDEYNKSNHNIFINDNNNEPVEVDMIIITRGGGSFEDLMGFSHPKVIEAIYNSKKYTISAVGHEIDCMLSDYVANYRAPTPSIAGEVVCGINVNNKKKLLRLERDIINYKHNMLQDLLKFKNNINHLLSKIDDPCKKVITNLNTILNNARSHIRNKIAYYQQKINVMNEILTKNDINKIILGGFVLLTNDSGNIIKDIDSVFDKEISLTHHTGKYDVIIKKQQTNKRLLKIKN